MKVSILHLLITNYQLCIINLWKRNYKYYKNIFIAVKFELLTIAALYHKYWVKIYK